jgi:hypothetical protein
MAGGLQELDRGWRFNRGVSSHHALHRTMVMTPLRTDTLLGHGHYCIPATIFSTVVKISCASSAWSGSSIICLYRMMPCRSMTT